MNEIVVTFGSEHRLIGTICLPTNVAPQSVAFVMLNAGVVSRMGPHRFNVKLARHLADLGFASLRFDLSGQGDSRPAPGVHSPEEQVMIDLREALDHLAHTTGIQQFVIAGICSGAVAAYYFAQRDARVVGSWMLDGYTFHTWRSQWIRLWGKFKRVFSRNWRDTLAKLQNALRPPNAAEEKVDYGSTRHPSKAEYIEAMQSMADRGMRSYMMFSSDIEWYYNYQGQFHDAFKGQPFARSVTTEYLPTIDHTITRLEAQQYVINRIGAWACTLANRPSP
ncbi:MAG TPA: alpha/beta fold hydrolase [Aquabacterium sp.]|nr:alpha/beta fold hydrolase [Aquabacterium sp.]